MLPLNCALCFFIIFQIDFSSQKTLNDCILDISNSFPLQIFNITSNEISVASKNLKSLNVTRNDVEILFYATDRERHLMKDDKKNLHLINPSYPIKVVVHGWKSNGRQEWVAQIAANYHKKGNYNVFAVDWSSHSSKNYVHSAAATQSVGGYVGHFFHTLDKSLKLKKGIHLIGHSLGAHVSGFIAKKYKHLSNKTIERITALDAAAPLFETPMMKPDRCRLCSSDAELVDSIHTENAGMLGFHSNIGKVDFYVNWGFGQSNNCSSMIPNIFTTITCGHQSSHDYFTQTILKPGAYEAVQCNYLAAYLTGFCKKNKKILMGDGVPQGANGTYYISINETAFEKNGEVW